MTNVKEILRVCGIIPVIKIHNSENAVGVANALCSGGIMSAEVTFRTDCAAECIYSMKSAHPEMFVGAGTVLTEKSLSDAIKAGADFVVAPGLNPRTAEKCILQDVPFIPGIMTPTEIEAALSLGIDFVKFFPAEAAGGVKMLKAMSAPYYMVSFMPTGGITMANAPDYLSLKQVVCCGGSFIVPDNAADLGDFETIRTNAQKTSELIHSLRK